MGSPHPTTQTSSRRRPAPSHRLLLTLTLALSTLPSTLLVNAQDQPLPCQRWAHQTTIGQGPSNSSNASTLWIYGGRVKSSPSQDNNTWTNALLSLDLSTSWNAGAPALTLVQKDTGDALNPPAVSLGTLWSSGDGSTLYQYGGQYGDDPYVAPGPQAVYQYGVKNAAWTTAQTQGDTVNRASEGAGAVVPTIGSGGSALAYYFGGHLDWSTVQGWSQSTPRVFLNSIIELDLGTLTWTNHSTFGNSGNIGTEGSVAEVAPTLRADATLTYIPLAGTNQKGMLVAIGGGENYASNDQNTNRSISNSALDVFDIGSNSWTKQACQGDIPPQRVNHCAVRGTAKIKGVLQHQIFVYAGQFINGTEQSTDLYILSIPSFTWTFVGNNLPAQPSARAGHTCDLIGSQMLVVGGFVASDLLCDSQSVYVLDTSTLTWQTKFTPGTAYKTPASLSNITGGIGTGFSTSGAGSSLGGDGSLWPDTSATFSGGGGKKSNIGAIVGGVVGGIVAFLLILLVLFLLRRRKRQQAEAAAAQMRRDKAAATPGSMGHERMPSSYWGSESGIPPSANTSGSEENGLVAGPAYEKFQYLGQTPAGYFPAASDDPEGETRNYEAQFSTRLAPKQQLRVVNPESDD